MRDEDKCPYLSIEQDMGKTMPLCGKVEGKICDNCESAKNLAQAVLGLWGLSTIFLGGDDNAAD